MAKYKGKEYRGSKFEKILELAAKQGVEAWEIDPNEIYSDDESKEEETINEAKEHEEEKTKFLQEEITKEELETLKVRREMIGAMLKDVEEQEKYKPY
ncbi:unnamed protein product [Blepharisma stoltei]|uniref:Uncharacterized protein n=1 Tax=Blepharisma stoltei TaxID=1481888 RepID=A0AAU9JNL3_9CILI|nr:unnamed protein product [Blepharisma stoltei]